MKAYEVKMRVIGGSKNQTRTLYVQAKTKKELESLDLVLKVWERKDMSSDDCPNEIMHGGICEK